jgi:hypothetical protein
MKEREEGPSLSVLDAGPTVFTTDNSPIGKENGRGGRKEEENLQRLMLQNRLQFVSESKKFYEPSG